MISKTQNLLFFSLFACAFGTLLAQPVTRQVPRLTVVEEFTGVNCVWCSRGWVGMGLVKQQRPQNACVIAWHKYKDTDPMYVDNYASFSYVGYPKCSIDRRLTTDPYDGQDHHGILYEVDQLNQLLPTVEVKCEARYTDATMTTVSVTAQTEFLADANGYTIAFALTADSLSGSKRSWWQSNAYASYDPDYVDNDPLLSPLCRGGEYGYSQIKVVYDDVLIGSTYGADGQSALPAFGAQQAAQVITTSGTVAMPESETLSSAISYDKVYATVLVIDDHGKIANAARSRVLMPDEEAGIEDVTTDRATPQKQKGYDLRGRHTETSIKGLQVRNGRVVWQE